MTVNNELPQSMRQWQENFIEVAAKCSDELLKDAKKYPTYGEATSYIRKVNGMAKGTVDGRFSSAGMKLNDVICELTINRLYDEERQLPIMRGESDGD